MYELACLGASLFQWSLKIEIMFLEDRNNVDTQGADIYTPWKKKERNWKLEVWFFFF